MGGGVRIEFCRMLIFVVFCEAWNETESHSEDRHEGEGPGEKWEKGLVWIKGWGRLGEGWSLVGRRRGLRGDRGRCRRRKLWQKEESRCVFIGLRSSFPPSLFLMPPAIKH